MGIFNRVRPAGHTVIKGGSKMSISEQDATRLIEKGHILEAENRFDEAMQCYLGAIRLAPNLARAHLNHGNVLLLKGDLPSALDAFRTAIKYKPDYAGAYYNIGNALMNNGHLNDAVVNYRLALEIKPDYAEVLCSLGIAFKDLGKLDDAVANLESALEINPDLVEAHINLGNVKQALMQFEGAVTCYRQAIEVDTDLPELHNNLGLALNNLGEIESALGSFRQALKINPDYAEPYSNMLFTLHYVVTHKPSYYFEQALQYGRLITSKVGMRFSDWQCAIWPERLRVGLLSGDLRNHVVGHFLEGTLAHVNPARIELIAYPTNRQEDELTARIRPCFSEWKPLFGKDDEAAARLIHADRVHILLDISGHTAHTRLPVFAWKPAPVQATWLGYFATTGVAEMDYLLADEVGVPQASQEQFTESVTYLIPDCALPRPR
jgi:protein O-GlcNAc transferase